MEFNKKGHIFKPTGEYSWSRSHAQVPFAFKLNDDVIRVFFATRDENSSSSTSFVDVDADNPSNILKVHDQPVIQKGSQGSFDDSGTMPSWFLMSDNKLLLYYTAWNRSKEASYRLSIGLAESTDNGLSFTKLFKGPVLDRNINDPIWVGQPCVLKEADVWKMWYLCCEKIEIIDGHPEPFYNVKYAESQDGINWVRNNETCIGFEDGKTEAIGRPCVWRYKNKYWMFHSNRMAKGYRDYKEASYRIELSSSTDGIHWNKEEWFEMPKSGNPEEWDGMMNEYTSVVPKNDSGEFYVFYNGNGFGGSGFGYFVLNLD
ncbi:hypothetical protein [Parvicella tangerina]|uniref:Glycosyl hydrolase family 32 N-terminal domain-containing protein n=1 Tax=Parvicella tangerina TaxID=2829795 RepID=A0A916JL68_9FLAO|nr:hypothetical protein [Parvicella tangerina]CAG5079706.1 hypothetical protein CRYO30217_01026 [Parvicella tangerina]